MQLQAKPLKYVIADLLWHQEKKMNETATIMTWMQHNALFTTLPEQALADLASQACLKTFNPDQVLIEENGDNDALFLLTKGQVAIIINDTEVATQQAGETIGEISMSKISPAVACVIATENVEAVSFPVDIIETCCTEYPEFALCLRTTGLQKVYGR